MPTEAHWHSPERARSVCLAQLAALTERLAEADVQKKAAAEAFEREQPALLEQEARLREALPLYDSWEAAGRRLAQAEQAFRKTAETRKKTEEEKENSAAALALLKAEQEEKSRAPLLLQKSREKRKRTEEKLDRIRSLKARLENLKERQTALSRGTASAPAGDQPLRRGFQRI